MDILLKCGANKGIAASFGGELVSFTDENNTEYVWHGDEKYWTGRAPVLFPVVGALKDNTTIIDGKQYTIQKHGFARKSEFELIESDESSAELELLHSEKTLALYPYKFSLRIKHTLTESGFTTTYTVINLDSRQIEFGIGGHAGFNIPLEQGYEFSDYCLKFNKTETSGSVYTDKNSYLDENLTLHHMKDTDTYNLNHSDFDIDVFIIKDIKSDNVDVVNKKTGKGFNFSFKGFKSLGIWSPPGKKSPFFCLEPWNSIPDYVNSDGIFANKPGIIKLAAGEQYSVGYEMRIKK